MKTIAWNIYQGGGKRTSPILDALTRIDADVCVLTEFNEQRSESLMKSLRKEGWEYQDSSFSKATGAGLAIASRFEFQSGDIPECPDEGRWLHVRLPGQDIDVCAAYAPLASRHKGEYWDWMIDAVGPLLLRKTLIVGDLNNGLSPQDHSQGANPLPKWKKMQEFIDSGWTDLFRHQDPVGNKSSWWTNQGAGFRIDHAFGSPSLRDALTSVSYVTEIEGAYRPLVDTSGPSAGWTDRASSDHALLEVIVNAGY